MHIMIRNAYYENDLQNTEIHRGILWKYKVVDLAIQESECIVIII
jgi:hypothetical protein